jgi:amino acid adenylation domain-containing protein
MDELNKRIANLSSVNRELLNKRLRALADKAFIRPRNQTGPAALSSAQERLWFLYQLEPNSPVYNVPMGLRIKGELNIAVLHQSLMEIVRRHEALRSRFEMVDGSPVQVIESSVSLEVPLTDLMSMPQDRREAEAMKLCREEARRPFDLKRDLMLRARLFRLGQADHILVLNLHHIVSDGWSFGVLFPELRSLYAAFIKGKPSPLAPLPIQYADFAVWQRASLLGEETKKEIAYWKKQLEGVPALLELPTDRPRTATQSQRGATARGTLPASLLQGLEELSRSERATLFMTLMAAFQTLLRRYTGAGDILVGSPVAGRQDADLGKLIGLFVNTLVMRGDLSGNPTFRKLLAQTREAAFGAFGHQSLPFERLVAELNPERNASHAPIVQVLFAFQNAPWQAPELLGTEVTIIPLDSGTSRLDLSLIVRQRDGEFQTAVEYNTDLFDEQTIRRMMGHYQILLEGIVSNPDQRLSELPLLTPRERQQILVDWNQTQADYPKDRCTHELVEEQARRAPDAVAAVFKDTQLTYGQLNDRANQLARHLQKLGVGPGALVTVCVERSLEMVVGLLGVLKAGAAYVPVDPGNPKERLAFMLQDSGSPVLLTQQRLRDTLPVESSNYRFLCLDADWETIAQSPPQNPGNSAGLQDLVYVIYTSGSTGTPKGVELIHGGLLNFIFWKLRTYQIRPGDRVTHLAGVGFDASVWELWPTLAAGATIHMADEETRLSPEKLRDWLVEQQITLSFVPTPLAEALMALKWPSRVALQTMLTGGDRLTRYAPPTLPFKLVNHYGPTETTVLTTYATVEVDDKDGKAPPIGRPISNTQTYILDSHLQATPIGVPGELHIGGIGLARGYLRRPELTAEKFIPHPFSQQPGERLYKTGDLVRYLPDGSIEFLGRNDGQVKIRGFRIELGEIESVLAKHPAIRGVVVVAQEDESGQKRLVAYMTTRGVPPTIAELREHLKKQMPEHMVPAVFVTLEEFPLTPNGKVDRKALPKPEVDAADEKFEPPATATEIALANIWSGVLGVKRIGLHHSFFDLGGHSLLAVRVASRVSVALQVGMPLRTLINNPTLAACSRQIDNLLWARGQTSEVAVEAAVEGSI